MFEDALCFHGRLIDYHLLIWFYLGFSYRICENERNRQLDLLQIK